MSEIKLTATWNGSEGNLSKADVERLTKDPTMAELDFLGDVLVDVEQRYNVVRLKVFPRRLGPFSAAQGDGA